MRAPAYGISEAIEHLPTVSSHSSLHFLLYLQATLKKNLTDAEQVHLPAKLFNVAVNSAS